jgi:hypothetical protein
MLRESFNKFIFARECKKNDGLQVFHDDEEGGDIRAEVGAELRQEGAQAGGRQEDHRQHDRRQGQSEL